MTDIINIDDWNTIFNKIPKIINDHTYDTICNTNNCIDRDNYMTLKFRLTTLMKDIGNFEYINHATGDQAVVHAVMLSRKYLGIKHIYVVKEAFHGITLKYFREGILNFEGISIFEFELNCLERAIENCRDNSLLIIEPFLFFANYGNDGIKKIKHIVTTAKKNGVLILFDEIRSGVFSTGPFLFSQKCLPIDIDFICFSKGLALGVPTSVLAIKAGIFLRNIIKNEDIFKSCMAISDVAMQRSNDLLAYYLDDSSTFNKRLSSVTEKISKYFGSFANTSIVNQVNIIGLCCIFTFNENVKKAKLRLLWLHMLSRNIEVRPIEGNLWIFNFALDSSDEEFAIVRDELKVAMELIDNN